MRFILCIDDEPIRYRGLKMMLALHPEFEDVKCLFTCRYEDVKEYLTDEYNIIGVCLDHDMPQHNGNFFAGILKERNFPVAIVSLNPSGAQDIFNSLSEYETPCIKTPCSENGWDARALRFFLQQG